MYKIIIAEDDLELLQLFKQVLTQNGFFVKGVTNGKEALDELQNNDYDVVISDIMMPVMDGYTFVRELRAMGNNVPLLMITAKDAFNYMYMGFQSGTDDYMVKPININELVLRVNALLRRAKMLNDRKQILGSTIIEWDTMSVVFNGERVVLPQKEFMLLYKLSTYPGRIFTRRQLMDEIWGFDSESDEHTVEVHIGKLRERFRENTDFKIVTIRGVGYKVVKS